MIRESNTEPYEHPGLWHREAITGEGSSRPNGRNVLDLVVEILHYNIPEPQTIFDGQQEFLDSFRPFNENNLAATPEREENALYDFEAPDLDALAEEQGVAPIEDIDELVADFWPEDESLEDFMAAVRRWRHEGNRQHD
jgi:hypothetical protein